jgi:glycosyltransferase involved in cell wall biosynthesis
VSRVLFLAYYFPPIGGAGVQRSVKFARYLPEYGWQPVVVTGPGAASGRWTPRDETLHDELPDGIEVVRVPGPEPPAASGWEGRLERWARRRTAWSRWWTEGAVETGRSLEGIDVVYASMSPWDSGEAAARLAELLGVPWVADLRDPWALDEMLAYPSTVHRRLELRRMGRLLSRADAVVMNTPEAAAQARRAFPSLAEERVYAIPNGYDAADFAAPPPVRDDDAFRIVHTGYLHTAVRKEERSARVRRVLGGTLGDVDVLPRSHVFLLEAVRGLLRESPDAGRSVEIHLAGELTEEDEREIDLDVVHTHGYLDHASTVALMRSADLLFLPMHDLPAGQRARIVPGKTYEYLASGRPILAGVPDGDARDLLAASGTALLCRPSDAKAMKEAIAGRLDARGNGDAQLGPVDATLLGRYERRALTRELAAVLDRVSTNPRGTTRGAA